jgi:quercetin dioxygenase-like cupin family protein
VDCAKHGKDKGRSGRLSPSDVTKMGCFVDYAPGGVVSRTLVEGKSGTITAFSFDAGEGLSEHSAPFDAFVQLIEGKLELTIGGKPHTLTGGEAVLMPANVPHALRFPERSKMLLVMIRG